MATRKRRSAAQKAATRKLVALNRARRGSTTRRRRRNPIAAPARRRRRNPGPVATYVTNPRRRSRRRAAPTRYRRRRNPSSRWSIKSMINAQIIPAAIGGTGAIGLDLLYGQAKRFLPLALQVDPWQNFAKAGVALAGGMLAAQVVRPATAHQLTQGALTVIMRDAILGFIPIETKMSWGLGEYMESGMQGLGYYNAGQVSSPQTDASLGYSNYSDQLTPMGEYMTDMVGEEY